MQFLIKAYDGEGMLEKRMEVRPRHLGENRSRDDERGSCEWREKAVMDNAGNRMWKCPKCGRTFKNENQSHYCGKSPETVDEYILAQDADIREQLQRVREAIRNELSDATEKISWSMPTWWSGHNIIHFAAQKKHIGLYPGPEAVAFFSEKLDAHGFKYSKGSIQIPYSDDLPLSLISEITAWCRDTGNHA